MLNLKTIFWQYFRYKLLYKMNVLIYFVEKYFLILLLFLKQNIFQTSKILTYIRFFLQNVENKIFMKTASISLINRGKRNTFISNWFLDFYPPFSCFPRQLQTELIIGTVNVFCNKNRQLGGDDQGSKLPTCFMPQAKPPAE